MTSKEWSGPPPGADWITALSQLSAYGHHGVLATITNVRGHAPRDAGAKMVVTTSTSYGSIGGGNMEATVIDQARTMLQAQQVDATCSERITTLEFGLNEHAPNQHGNQCCGGAVEVLVEYLPTRPVIALFGLGHVGQEIARILSRQVAVLHLTDSRSGVLDPQVQELLHGGPASVHVHHSAAPETIMATLPPGAHVLILTHDHAEDLILCEAGLRHGHLGTIGLIGSRAKWLRFHKQLSDLGYAQSKIDLIQSPIGVADITGKEPAVIAVSVAAGLLQVLIGQPS